MIKIIWVLIGINSLALIVVFLWYLTANQGKRVDTMESGWMTILFLAGIAVILLAALPLWFGHSKFSVIVAGFFSALPLTIVSGIYISNKMPSFKKKKTSAEYYYKDKTQRAIATAIENNDVPLLRNLIVGQDLNIPGEKIEGWDGLNYLHFAINLRSNPQIPLFNDGINKSIIRILIENNSETTSALEDAVNYLPAKMVDLMLDSGADPNVYSKITGDRLLFKAMGTKKEENDIALLLIKHGADVNAKAYGNYGMTPVMYAANNAKTSENWKDVWRVVRYMLEVAHCDYLHVTKDGFSFQGIMRTIRQQAIEKEVTMCPDFDTVVAWLKKNGVDTEPGGKGSH
jgi:hypothetical protein